MFMKVVAHRKPVLSARHLLPSLKKWIPVQPYSGIIKVLIFLAGESFAGTDFEINVRYKSMLYYQNMAIAHMLPKKSDPHSVCEPTREERQGAYCKSLADVRKELHQH